MSTKDLQSPFLLWTIIFAVISIVTIAMFLAFESLTFSLQTNQQSNNRIAQIGTIVIGCFLGILSKVVFERIVAGKRRCIRASRDLLFASIVSPIVIYPIYTSLSAITDFMIIFFISYQNGFFFSATLSQIENSLKSHGN